MRGRFFNLSAYFFGTRIIILNFRFSHKDDWPQEKFRSSYRLREDGNHEVMTDVLRFVFLELGRFRKCIWELENTFDRWMYLLKHMHEMMEIPHVFQAPDFKRLFILSETDNFTPEEYSEYQNSLTRMSDYYNIIDSAEKRAREEGREEARMEMALNLKRLGTSNDIIAQATGMAIDLIEEL